MYLVASICLSLMAEPFDLALWYGGLWDYSGNNWDYGIIPFEIGITEIMVEIWITGFQSNPNQG